VSYFGGFSFYLIRLAILQNTWYNIICDKVCQLLATGFLQVLRFPPPIKLTTYLSPSFQQELLPLLKKIRGWLCDCAKCMIYFFLSITLIQLRTEMYFSYIIVSMIFLLDFCNCSDGVIFWGFFILFNQIGNSSKYMIQHYMW
jgi:hypothetical protein